MPVQLIRRETTESRTSVSKSRSEAWNGCVVWRGLLLICQLQNPMLQTDCIELVERRMFCHHDHVVTTREVLALFCWPVLITTGKMLDLAALVFSEAKSTEWKGIFVGSC